MYDFNVSDHYPILASFSVASSPFPIWMWPTTSKVPKSESQQVEWTAQPTTYAAWSESCTEWLSLATQSCVPSKLVVHTTLPSTKQPAVHKTFARITAGQRALSAPFLPPPACEATPAQMASL